MTSLAGIGSQLKSPLQESCQTRLVFSHPHQSLASLRALVAFGSIDDVSTPISSSLIKSSPKASNL